MAEIKIMMKMSLQQHFRTPTGEEPLVDDCREVVGLDARKNPVDIGRAVEMRVDRNDTIHKTS